MWRRPNHRRCSDRASPIRPTAQGMCVAPRQETDLDLAEQIVDHVSPMAEHVGFDAASVLLAIVPGRALKRLVLAREYPVAEFTANGKYPPEKSGVDQALQL